MHECNLGNCPINCEWDQFGEWSTCSKSCGGGEKSRIRSKLKQAENGGALCAGDAVDLTSCNSHNCPIDCEWDSFGEWSTCSKSCGEGVTTRKRLNLKLAQYGGKECAGSAVEQQLCSLMNCTFSNEVKTNHENRSPGKIKYFLSVTPYHFLRFG